MRTPSFRAPDRSLRPRKSARDRVGSRSARRVQAELVWPGRVTAPLASQMSSFVLNTGSPPGGQPGPL